MLKFLRLPVAMSTAIISYLSFFPAGITQDEPLCFMVSSSGRVINLNNLCHQAQQALQKVSLCQGSLDGDGFPIALAPDLERLKTAVTKARQVSSSQEQQSAAMTYENQEVQSAMENLMNKIPSFAQAQEIQKKRIAFYNQSGNSINPEEAEKLEAEERKVFDEMNNDPCNLKLMEAFGKKMERQEFF